MIKITFLEFLLRGIPEDLIFFLAFYAFTKNKVQVSRYLVSSLVQATIVFSIRFLPIDTKVDTILNLILLITLAVFVNRIEVIKAIKAGIIIMILELLCEGINIFILQVLMKKDLNSIFADPMSKILYSSPSILIFGCIVIVYYFILLKRNELKDSPTKLQMN